MNFVKIMEENKARIREYFDSIAYERVKWRKKAGYFYNELKRNICFLVPENSSVLEIGCETGDFLISLKPRRGLGIDWSQKILNIAQKNYSQLEFLLGNLDNIETLNICETFDYIIVNNVIGYVDDIQNAFRQLKKLCRPDTRIIIIYYNYLWEPVLKLAEFLNLRMKRPIQNWFSSHDIDNFLYIEYFEVIKKKNYLLIPFYVPLISKLLNKFLANVSLFKKLSLMQVSVVRLPKPRKNAADVTASVVVPCRNEKNNIEQVVLRTPEMGKYTEIIFVEGHSQDNTLEECERVKKKYIDKSIKVFVQDGIGKGDAVRKGFSQATGDILMILDADLTVPPEDLPKFFEALISGKGELINGSRLVYVMEKQAMRFLNILGNKFFSYVFTFLLEQYLKDTLCGTKALWRQDYEKIAKNRKYFGDFDPFGDFDLLFGATKLNLKIVEIPVRYRERTYGSSQIRRFKHGWLLLKMAFFAINKIKFV